MFKSQLMICSIVQVTFADLPWLHRYCCFVVRMMKCQAELSWAILGAFWSLASDVQLNRKRLKAVDTIGNYSK